LEVLPQLPGLNELVEDLRATNIRLWDIEDEIRACEKNKEFDDHFISLARSVYQANDYRSLVKRKIAELLGSSMMDEKSYTNYHER